MYGEVDVDIFGCLVCDIGCVHNSLCCVCYIISLPCLIFPETPNLIFNEYYFCCCLLSGFVIEQQTNTILWCLNTVTKNSLTSATHTLACLLKLAIKEKGSLVDEEDTNKKQHDYFWFIVICCLWFSSCVLSCLPVAVPSLS